MYPLNDKDLALDISGNSNPSGTTHNVQEADGPFGGETSIWFDGTPSSYISISHNGDLSMDASFSILVWIYKTPIFGFGGHIATFESDNEGFSGLQFYGTYIINSVVGALHFPSSGETAEVGNFNFMFFNSGFWQHVALIYNFNSGYASLYVNKVLFGNKFVGSKMVGTSGMLIVGKSFRGRIACLQLYRRPLLLEHVEDAKDKCYRGGKNMFAIINRTFLLMLSIYIFNVGFENLAMNEANLS